MDGDSVGREDDRHPLVSALQGSMCEMFATPSDEDMPDEINVLLNKIALLEHRSRPQAARPMMNGSSLFAIVAGLLSETMGGPTRADAWAKSC